LKICVSVTISGIVQGVWFRASTKEKAEQLGITGWVRNTSDGNVEAIFEGDDYLIKEILKWCQQGPPHARVENVIVKNRYSISGFDEFTIKH
jgi:acylphosphatase